VAVPCALSAFGGFRRARVDLGLGGTQQVVCYPGSTAILTPAGRSAFEQGAQDSLDLYCKTSALKGSRPRPTQGPPAWSLDTAPR